MFWQEDEDKSIPYQVPDDVVDLGFTIQCKKLPLDHAWDLCEAIQAILPWAKEEKLLRIHQIHVAESGNGWLRPDDSDNETSFLWPSRRTKMHLRVPKARIEDAKQLSGKTLTLNKDYTIKVAACKERELSNASVLFSRQILSADDETTFLTKMHRQVFDLTGIEARKMIGGMSSIIRTPDGNLPARHLMIADLESDASVKIQQYGLGKGRLLGCGIFLPHKGIKSLHTSE